MNINTLGLLLVIIVAVIAIVVLRARKSNSGRKPNNTVLSTPVRNYLASFPPHIAEAIENAPNEQARSAGQFAYRIVQGGHQFTRQDVEQTQSFIRSYVLLYDSFTEFRGGGSLLASLLLTAFVQALLAVPSLAFRSKNLVNSENLPVIFMTAVYVGVTQDGRLGDKPYLVTEILKFTGIAKDFPALEAQNDGIATDDTNWYAMVSGLEKSARTDGWNGVYPN